MFFRTTWVSSTRAKGRSLFSVHVHLLISSTGLLYFQRKKGGQFTAITYLSVLSTLNKSNNKEAYSLVSNVEVKRPV